MRKVDGKIEDVIALVEKLKGKTVDVEVSRGRKKMVRLSGTIENLYPSIFTIKPEAAGGAMSCSYADVLCGDVKLISQETIKEA